MLRLSAPALAASASAVLLTAIVWRSKHRSTGFTRFPLAQPAASNTALPNPSAPRAPKLLLEFLVEPLHCSSCAADVEQVLKQEPGVSSVDVNVLKKLVVVAVETGENSKIAMSSSASLAAALDKSGRQAVLIGTSTADAATADPDTSSIVAEFRGKHYGHGTIAGVVRASVLSASSTSAWVEWQLSGLVPGAPYQLHLHAYGDVREPPRTLGKAIAFMGSVDKADEQGNAVFGPMLLENVPVSTAAGRGVAISSPAQPGWAIASVAARSAGVGENSDKRVCSCDGTTIWEAAAQPLEERGHSVPTVSAAL